VGESIRDEVTAGRMPPWPVDPTSPPVKGGYSINSRDLDRIVVWHPAERRRAISR